MSKRFKRRLGEPFAFGEKTPLSEQPPITILSPEEYEELRRKEQARTKLKKTISRRPKR